MSSSRVRRHPSRAAPGAHYFLGIAPQEAVTYNPHGFRHVMVGIGQQLKPFGVVSEEGLERLGHWEKGSAMPRRYDSAKGVTELRARSALLHEVRYGWRPAAEGSLPLAPHSAAQSKRGRASGCAEPSLAHPRWSSGVPSCAASVVTDPGGGGRSRSRSVTDRSRPLPDSGGRISVGHLKSRRIHVVLSGSDKTVCNMWTCGNRDAPVAAARFDDIPSHWTECRNCFR